jgi:hypothetical protein
VRQIKTILLGQNYSVWWQKYEPVRMCVFNSRLS